MENTANQPIKTKKELAMERLATRHPDRNFDDDEAVYGQILEDFADSDTRLAKYEENERALSDMFTADPRSAQFVINWRNGEDPAVGLVRMFGTEIKDAIDDPEKMEEIAEAQKDFVERVAKEKEYEQMYKDNLAQTLTNLEKVQAELGITDDQAEEAMAFLQTIISDGVLGKFTEESIKMAWKAISHDADVAQAAHEGEVKGRNTKIEEKLRTKKKGDGTAVLDGKNNVAEKVRKMPELGALSRFADGQSIWDRK